MVAASDCGSRISATPPPLRAFQNCLKHELAADRNEQISVDAKHPYRLILIPNHDETPRKPDGGLDWARITKVQLIEITDTH